MTPGIKAQLPEVRKLLAEAGAQVDEAQEVVHIPESLVRQMLKTVPSEFTLYNRAGEPAEMISIPQ